MSRTLRPTSHGDEEVRDLDTVSSCHYCYRVVHVALLSRHWTRRFAEHPSEYDGPMQASTGCLTYLV
jgi:hypothetical protein